MGRTDTSMDDLLAQYRVAFTASATVSERRPGLLSSGIAILDPRVCELAGRGD
jgi:hypothetical protein